MKLVVATTLSSKLSIQCDRYVKPYNMVYGQKHVIA